MNMDIKLLNKYNSKYQFHLVYEMGKLVLSKIPNNKMALITLGNIFSTICEQEKAIELYQKAHDLDLELSTMYYIKTNLWKIKFKTIQLAKNLNAIPKEIKFTTKKIKIGYIGNNFDNPNHPVSRFIFNILRFHSNKFKITCYQIGKDYNLPLSLNHRTFQSETNEEIANEIRKDKIDILIELMNHTSERIFVLSYKPSPIQISYCAFPGTTGMKEIDYKIMDKVSSDGIEKYFTEKILKLPNGFHTYCPTNFKPKQVDHEGIHFSCFNNPLKITKNTLLMWVYLLSKVPNSKLILQYHYYSSIFIQEKIKEKIKSSCIALNLSTEIEKRVLFVGFQQKKENILQMYNFIDISLDTYPYNGTTITCESLFMNVPVFTQMGKLPQSRIGASLLKSIQCDECIIESESMFTYVNRILEYCDKDKLNDLKNKIRRNKMKYELGNPKLFMKSYEEKLISILKCYII